MRSKTGAGAAGPSGKPEPPRDWGHLEHLPDAILVVDPSGRIVYANTQAESLSGYDRGELASMGVESLLPEQLRLEHAGHRTVYHAQPRVRSMNQGRDLSLRRRDGVEIPVDIALSQVETETGPVVIAAARDTTLRRQAEESIRQHHFHAVFDGALEAMMILDEEFRVVEANPAACELLGLSTEQLIGRSGEGFIGPGVDFDQVSQTFLEAGVLRGEAPIVGSDGEPREIEFAATANVLPGRHLAVFRDVSERVRAQRELESSFRLLQEGIEQRRLMHSRLMAAQEEERQRISADIHDDPIQKMVAAALRLDMLRDRVREPDLRNDLDRVRESVKIAIERLRNTIFELRPPALDRDGLAITIGESLAAQAAEGPGFEYKIDDRLPSEPDPETRGIAYRVAQEALANIRKHAHANNVSVSLEDSEGGLLVRISDDGVGFSSGEFEEYQPGHLGMASMRERVELAGGRFLVESAPDRGATVEFWLPGAGESASV